jgi:hypothetical protein
MAGHRIRSGWAPLYEATDFPVNRDCDIYRKLTETHYNKMHEMLERSVEREFSYLFFLLRQVWKKHESKMIVNKYDADYKDVGFGKEERTGEYEVYININYDTQELDDRWYAAYQTIFHEFFHNIDHLADYKSYTYKNRGFDHFDKEYQFGEIIISEVKNILEEEKKAGPKEKTRLRAITYDIANKKHKAALYDIIGAVLYYGKYGCNPDNSEFYTKDGKKCGDKCVCNYALSRTNSKTAICEHRKERKNVENSFYNYNCSKTGGCDYKKVCSLRANDWCNIIHGHGSDYWLVKEKGDKEDDKKGFPMRLAEEAFVLMASEAVANLSAFGNLKKYLPKSYKMFVQILKEMLHEEFEMWNELWTNLTNPRDHTRVNR